MLEHKQVWFDFHSSLHHGRLHHGLHRIRKGMRTFLTPPRASLHSRSMAKSLNLGLRHENLRRWRSKTQGTQERLSFFLTCSPGCPQIDCIYMRVTLNVWYPSLYLLSLWDYRCVPTHLVRVVLGMEPWALGMFSEFPASWAPAPAWECYFSAWIWWRRNFVSKMTGPKRSIWSNGARRSGRTWPECVFRVSSASHCSNTSCQVWDKTPSGWSYVTYHQTRYL